MDKGLGVWLTKAGVTHPEGGMGSGEAEGGLVC